MGEYQFLIYAMMLFFMGYLMIVRADIFWEMTKRTKGKVGKDPSASFRKKYKLYGAICFLIGIALLWNRYLG